MKFVFVAAVLLFAFSQGKNPVEKVCCMKGKTREKFVCKGRLVALNVELARVAMVEHGNFVCEFHWHQLRTRNNVCSCPLASHSSTMSTTPIPVRLYEVFDQAGRNMASYRPGTRWCTSCRRNADRKFSSMPGYQKPTSRKKVGSLMLFYTVL